MNVAAVIIIGAAVVAAAVFVLPKKRKKVPAPEPEVLPENVTQSADGDDRTEFIGGEKGGTALLFSAGQVFNIVLTDRDDPEKVFTARVGDVVIGRSREKADVAIGYDKSVSKEHCRVFEDDGKIFVQDLGSANLTYVDDRPVNGCGELSDGCELRLGRLRFTVGISPK